jgi:hypothetical protein
MPSTSSCSVQGRDGDGAAWTAAEAAAAGRRAMQARMRFSIGA